MTDLKQYAHELVDQTMTIDVHSHQGTRGVWQAADLWTLLSYHWLATDIRCAGCPREVFFDKDMEPRDRVAQTVPFLKWTQNTVNHWCFMNMARDLYGFQHPYLDESNWEWLWDAVAERVDDPQWEAHVLDLARVEMASADYHVPARLPQRYFMYDYGESLFCPALSARAGHCLGRIPKEASSAHAVCEAITAEVNSLASEHQLRALHVWAPITWTYSHVEEGRANALIHKACAGAHMETSERDQLASFTADCTARACGELGIVIQLFFGSMTMEDGGPQVSMYRPEWLRALVPFFSEHRNTNFDVFMATRVMSHEAAVLARNYPNLWLSGAWWQGFTPSTLSEFFRDRLEMLPMNKWNAFYSDAYCVEWIYGKVTLSRNRLAISLAEIVEEGLIERDMMGDLARAVLYENPRRLYLGIEG